MGIFSVIASFVLCAGIASAASMEMGHMDHTDHDMVMEGPSEHLSMSFAATPASPRAGEPVTLSFTPSHVDLEEAHGALMHLIGVRRDVKQFFHTHPEPQANGSFAITRAFPEPGRYAIWLEAKRMGMLHRFEYALVVRSAKPSLWERITGTFKRS